eukprot:14383834-Alexandrium_andersonii.AAC.1
MGARNVRWAWPSGRSRGPACKSSWPSCVAARRGRPATKQHWMQLWHSAAEARIGDSSGRRPPFEGQA